MNREISNMKDNKYDFDLPEQGLELINEYKFSLHDIFYRYLDDYDVPEGVTVVCALSGGADSVCLLMLMLNCKQINTVACHVHHGIRGEEADRDAEFCQKLCDEYGVPLMIINKDVPAYMKKTGKSMEEAARELRYEALSQCCKDVDAYGVMTAHHETDNAETVIMNLLRGTGIKGLGGIPPKCQMSKYWLMRPLLTTSKEHILEYLQLAGIEYVVDSTNQSVDTTRNYLRNEIFPKFTKINYHAISHIAMAAERVRAELTFSESVCDEVMKKVSEKNGIISVSAQVLKDTHETVRKSAFLRMYRMASNTHEMLTGMNFADINDLLYSKSPSAQLSMPYSVTVFREYDKLCMAKLLSYPSYDIPLPVGGKKVKVACFSVSCKKATRLNNNLTTFTLDSSKIDGILSVRNRKEGDKIAILGRNGTKTVKKAMIDAKIPRNERENLPVIYCGDKVLAVYGLGVSRDVAATDLENAITVKIKRLDM